MELRQRTNHWLPKKLGVGAITLYPWILYASESPSKSIKQHEMIHVQQIRKLGWCTFYWRYIMYYVFHRLRSKSHMEAYNLVLFEIEAYGVNHDG